MARPFKNSSSANKAFGGFSESQNTGDYIYNKKIKSTYCNANICTPSLTVGSESNYLLFKRAYRSRVYPCLNSINKANLNINLITKLNLPGVPVIQDFSGNAVPSTIDATIAKPYLRYNIDPSGNLFGNDICGINNWEKYMIYGDHNSLNIINISYTGALRSNSNPYTGTNKGYTYLKFINSGTINIISDSGKIYYVIVGGGGSGNTRSSNNGGGGGGGGQVLSGFVNLTKGVYNITVGSSGQPSSFYTLTAATGLNATFSGDGGGNGGNSGSGGLGGFGITDVNNLLPGNPGFNGGGGGGGYNVYPAGTGGPGPLINFADGSSGIYFGGGGGGGVSGPPQNYNPASGGAGGGGNGGGSPTGATGGSPNTGGGGGGGPWSQDLVSPAGGAGASGVVLIYYL
jgi:hypothetical protein